MLFCNTTSHQLTQLTGKQGLLQHSGQSLLWRKSKNFISASECSWLLITFGTLLPIGNESLQQLLTSNLSGRESIIIPILTLKTLRHRAGKSHWKSTVNVKRRNECLLLIAIIPSISLGTEVALIESYQHMWRGTWWEVWLAALPWEKAKRWPRRGSHRLQQGWYVWQSKSSLAEGEDIQVNPSQGWRQPSWISLSNAETQTLQSIMQCYGRQQDVG